MTCASSRGGCPTRSDERIFTDGHHLHPSFAVHPGPWLRVEIVEPHGLSVTVAAEKLGVTRQAMSNLLNGNAGLSAQMATRFEKTFGVRADTMLRMQAAHDLAQARAHEGEIRVKRVAA